MSNTSPATVAAATADSTVALMDLCPTADVSGHRTIADRLGPAGLEEMTAAAHDLWTRRFAPAWFTHDGNVIVGGTYRCDYRAEEEWGIADLRKRLCGNNHRRHQMLPDAGRFVSICSDANAFALSTGAPLDDTFVWGDRIGRSDDTYATHWDRDLEWCAEPAEARSDRRRLERLKVVELRTVATAEGVPAPLPRRKADLVDAIVEFRHGPFTTMVWPGWFHDGQTLVVRADTGPAATVVEGLRDALVAGTFGIGSASGPFHSGVLFYDCADETTALRAERDENYDWYDARMAELAPAKAALVEKGHRFYFLGQPSEFAPRDRAHGVYYWLNGSGSPQPSGWYSLAELEAEVFVDDAKRRADERRAAGAVNA